ncbi:AraC family transcriptional regulator [Acerihabitans arboris]|uniref:Helix-turn-helix domain-containing protein n=1 Tax=Acerihabitans arboris TaxID=2691583 RepID=A0A845SEL1_9GAMM|nr:AraC family transcriptional regulator [Acerihabitans arboris]NDL63230.1 helix-turn-helix domain-containing protein [Acerihabitans arboris]
MQGQLLNDVRQYAETHSPGASVIQTPIAGMVILRELRPGELQYAVSKPLIAVVLQGGKYVSIGNLAFDFGAGESLLITAEVPTVSQITHATPAAPYYSLVLELDIMVIESLLAEISSSSAKLNGALQVERTEDEVVDVLSRMLKLFRRPAALPILQQSLVRELHYWLLTGSHGGAIQALGAIDSHTQRLGRAIGLIRAEYASPLRMERLAACAGMSLSGFHTHFRALTSLTPLQFQKQLRLIEARRIMLADGATASDAAFAVGYESIPHFTREYSRMFGNSPGRDIREARGRRANAA